MSLESLVPTKENCSWKQDEDGIWWTDCDNGFTFDESGPVQNNFKFCPYCGVKLSEEWYKEEYEP